MTSVITPSVIVPVRDAEPYIGDTLASLARNARPGRPRPPQPTPEPSPPPRAADALARLRRRLAPGGWGE